MEGERKRREENKEGESGEDKQRIANDGDGDVCWLARLSFCLSAFMVP